MRATAPTLFDKPWPRRLVDVREDGQALLYVDRNRDYEGTSPTPAAGAAIGFHIDPTRKHRPLNGLDDIAFTLQRANRIRATSRSIARPTPGFSPHTHQREQPHDH